MTQHPLSSLTIQEIQIVANTVRIYESDDDHVDLVNKLRFSAISLKEPSKDLLLQYQKDDTIMIPRQAEVVAMNPVTGYGSEYIVTITTTSAAAADTTTTTTMTGNVTHHKVLDYGIQPMLSPDDCDLAEVIVYNSPEVMEALQQRYGITDMKRIACDPWCINIACEKDIEFTKWHPTGKPARLVQNFLYYRANGHEFECNQQSHPIDIVPIVDLNERKLICIDGMDRNDPIPTIPMNLVNFHRNLLQDNTYLEKEWRTEKLKKLHVIQPDGPSFTVSPDNVVSWQKWSIRVGFNYREGIVLYDISFAGRPIMNRVSLVEMTVPYGDIYSPYHRKCAFDVGDYGLGYCANSLKLGCDCLGHIHYFSFPVINSKGEPIMKENVICMHEVDNGILWKHVEYRNNYNESRRSRTLVISSIATVVNYEYLFYWIFKLDGTIEYEVKLTGELATNHLSPHEEKFNHNQPTHGLIVAPEVNSQIHQHIFCVRMDITIDGLYNTVSEIDIVPSSLDDDMKNPYGNGFEVQETVLATEMEAIRTIDPLKGRCWKISNRDKVNPINHKPIAYKLIPFTYGPAHPVLLAHPTKSFVGQKGIFATANVWVTRYHEQERYPAGEYTPQKIHVNDDNLYQWIYQRHQAKNNDNDDECSIIGQDIVVWHSFGLTHIPRIEDFPIMPCESTGFTLKADNFFSGNPTIDLPPDEDEKSIMSNSKPSCSACTSVELKM